MSAVATEVAYVLSEDRAPLGSIKLDIEHLAVLFLPGEFIGRVAELTLCSKRLLRIHKRCFHVRELGLAAGFGKLMLMLIVPKVLGAFETPTFAFTGQDFR